MTDNGNGLSYREKLQIKISKLPSSLRHYIHKLEADNADKNAKLYAMASPEGTTVELGRGYGEQKIYLPEGSTICFHFGGDDVVEVGMNKDKDGISVYTEGGYPAVLPDSSNVFTVKMVQRR